MQEIVAEWNREMDRKAADFTQSEALGEMALEAADVEGADAEAMLALLKKAYRKQALKLHPDKNPDGPEPFLRMQRAYQALIAQAQGEAEIGGGPRPQRLTLLLRAQVRYACCACSDVLYCCACIRPGVFRGCSTNK